MFMQSAVPAIHAATWTTVQQTIDTVLISTPIVKSTTSLRIFIDDNANDPV